MNIEPVQNQSFKARLFAPNGVQVKTFGIFHSLGKDEIAQMANPNTDIYVNRFFTQKRPDELYQGFAGLTVKNPLWGESSFVSQLCRKQPEPYRESYDDSAFYDALKMSTERFDLLENKALLKAIIAKAKDSLAKICYYAKYRDSNEASPQMIFKKMLEACPEHGFSPERINRFESDIGLINYFILNHGLSDPKNFEIYG